MRALVTGAGSGIGEKMALGLAARGYEVVAAGRNAKRLHRLMTMADGGSILPFAADLSREEECRRLHAEAGDIDILVNNAGMGVFGEFGKTALEEELAMIDLNIRAPHILTKLFLKDFTARNSGYILNVASVAAFSPGPLFAGYYASKAYLLRLTQGIAEELRRAGSGVYIGALCPGPVKTKFNQKAGAARGLSGLDADVVADYAIEKMFAKKTVIIPGALMKCVAFFDKLMPDALISQIAYGMQRKKMND